MELCILLYIGLHAIYISGTLSRSGSETISIADPAEWKTDDRDVNSMLAIASCHLLAFNMIVCALKCEGGLYFSTACRIIIYRDTISCQATHAPRVLNFSVQLQSVILSWPDPSKHFRTKLAHLSYFTFDDSIFNISQICR